MKVLVVFYSRTGTTRRLAEAAARVAGWDVEELIDTRPRAGLLGYLRSAIDGTFERLTQLRATRTNPADYDLVVVGTPVWNASLSSPVRTWLTERRDQLKRVAFFVTLGGSGAQRVLRQMAKLARLEPLGVYRATAVELERDGVDAHARRLVSVVDAELARLQPPGAPPPGERPSGPTPA